MTAIGLFDGMTGYRGKFRTSDMPMSFWEAWTVTRDLAALLFVVTFLVLAIWIQIRWRLKPDRTAAKTR
jgi:hypothetical protein